MAHALLLSLARGGAAFNELIGMPSRPAEHELTVCPLCERAIPPAQRDAHHLIPKSKGGRHTQFLHRVCHRQIHALLSETELARHYATVEALLAHPQIRSFVDWVKTKPDDFFVATRKSARLRRR